MAAKKTELRPGALIELTIERPAVGGRMIGRYAGRIVLVSGAIPGERVRARIEGVRREVPLASVEDVLQVGQETDVFVLRVDRETKRIALSLRRLQQTPWAHAADTYQVNQLVNGTITKLTDFGAFARIDDTLEGLIHISELTETQIRHPREVVNIGDTMELRIVSMDVERHRLGLSIRQVEDSPTEYRDPDPVVPFDEDSSADAMGT